MNHRDTTNNDLMSRWISLWRPRYDQINLLITTTKDIKAHKQFVLLKGESLSTAYQTFHTNPTLLIITTISLHCASVVSKFSNFIPFVRKNNFSIVYGLYVLSVNTE